MKSRVKGRKAKVSAAFEASAIKTEWSGSADLMHWMRQIIEKEGLDLGLPDVETMGPDRKRPDLVIYESRRSDRILCLIEAKAPYFDVFNEDELKKPAKEKANRRNTKYFALTNFKQLIWYSTEKVNGNAPEEEQIKGKYSLSEIENLDEIKESRFIRPTVAALRQFLIDLYEVHTGKKPERKLPIDELLVFRLHEKIRILAKQYSRIIDERYQENPKFRKELGGWFADQNWQFAGQKADFDKAARQTAYLLINKTLFYDLLHAKRPRDLDPLEIPEGLTKGSRLATTLQGYFSDVLKIDYETIYDSDFIDSIAFPDSKEVVTEIKDLVRLLRRYDLARLGYDIVGRIFERLIPEEERHNLGQYFTRSDVVDLILRFCLKHEDDKVLDPACGAGTFLVRAYQHKKMMNQRLEHEKILETLWGNDIAKFPAHLATINLAIKGLEVDKNYPNILQEDFFALLVQQDGFDNENWRKRRAKTLGVDERTITYPRYFDAIVGNPPYTRQEEISRISEGDKKYKQNLRERALLDIREMIGKRAGIHAYFFVHGFKFLKQGGRFGFIVSESWLDVDYGKGLQEFFLKNYKIIAIITSKIERWFEEADINTCIIILEKCDKKTERDANLCRFVYLKKPLTHFIPPAQEIWEKEHGRLQKIDELIRTISGHDVLYENDDLRIYPKSQKELWEEGTEIAEDGPQQHTSKDTLEKYVGSKWGKYLRAPEIFFKILEKGRDKLVPLKRVAFVRRGFTTGVNEFFYLTEEEIKRERIEKEFWMHKDEKGNWVPNYVIKSPRECNTVYLKPLVLKYRILMIHKDRKELKGTQILKFIEKGVRDEFHKGPTCAARQASYLGWLNSNEKKRPPEPTYFGWYDIGFRIPGRILFPMVHNDRQAVFLNDDAVQVDHNLFEVNPYKEEDTLPVFCFLLSTVSMLFKEFGGRVNLGEGALKTEGIDIERLLVPFEFSDSERKSLNKWIEQHPNFEINSIFDDIQTELSPEVSLDKIQPDRRELDKIIMGDILGLTEEEQLEVYKAVVDLVRSRIDKAASVDKGKRYVEGVDVDAMAGSTTKRYKEKKK